MQFLRRLFVTGEQDNKS